MAGAPSPLIDGVFFGKICNRTADAQDRVSFGRIVSDRHQQRKIDTNLVRSGNPGACHVQCVGCTGETRRQRKTSNKSGKSERKEPGSAGQCSPPGPVNGIIKTRCRCYDHR
jgi:hypothetical protein